MTKTILPGVLGAVISSLVPACFDPELADAADDDPVAESSDRYALWLQPGRLTGFNVAYFNYGEGTKQRRDFEDLAAMGVTLVQIQSNEGTRHAAAPYEVNPDGVAALSEMVGWCRELGLNYVIAVRAGPGRQSVDLEADDPIWTSAEARTAYAQMLRDDIADEFGDDPLFVGLNLMVEPNPLAAQIDDGTVEDVADLRAEMDRRGIDLDAMMADFIAHVRQAAPTLPVIVQSAGWAGPHWIDAMQPQDDPFVVYDVHVYDPYSFTHPDCGAPNCADPYPGSHYGEPYDRDYLAEELLAPVIAFQQRHAVPIMMGEFGMEYEQEGGLEYLTNLKDIAAENGWNWCLWNFRSDPGDPEELSFDYEKWSPQYWEEISSWWAPR